MHLLALNLHVVFQCSIGGAVYMNAGAYGGEVKDCIDYALCVNEQGSLIKFTTKELELDYRNSIIQKNT